MDTIYGENYSSKNTPSITVLLSTYNGEKYLSQQIDSLLSQKDVNLFVSVRDDGSTDSTCEMLKSYESLFSFRIINGKNIGVASSFLELLNKSPDSQYYAFCDQDDVWDEDKLIVAIHKLHHYEGLPALYFSSTRVVDAELRLLSEGIKTTQLYVFNLHEVLLGNNATGCTMVLNKDLRDLLTLSSPKDLIMHDHWIYAVCIAVHGKVIFDESPHLDYRQHQNNVLGQNVTLKKRITSSSFCHKNVRSKVASQILDNYAYLINEDYKSILRRYAYYRNNIFSRIDLVLKEIRYVNGLARKGMFLLEVIIGIF